MPKGRVLGTVPKMTDSVEVPRIEIQVQRESGGATKRAVVIDGDICRIGSHPSNEVVLNDPLVSRFHCRLTRESSGWKIQDTGSLNGTMVNGVRVRDADLPRPECRIDLGQSTVVIAEGHSVNQVEVPPWPSFGSLVGTSLVMRRLFGLLDRVARSDSTVLVEGETGTGKEVIAGEIVRRGPRAAQPFVIVDCGAISPTLIESELFGHVRGAFTGADRDRTGAFEAANGGTVFLDEIGEMPLELQPKLLRAIESREIRRVGEHKSRKIDVRVVAATNRRLEREVNHGRFREDLYFRLSVVTVRVPSLRERLDDIAVLVNVFLRQMGADDRARLFNREVLADMCQYDWPGNVRELRNYVERSIVLDAAQPATREGSSAGIVGSGTPAAGTETAVNIDQPFKEAKNHIVEAFEKRYLAALLEWSQGNVSLASRKSGLDRMYLHRLLQRHGLRGDSSMKD